MYTDLNKLIIKDDNYRDPNSGNKLENFNIKTNNINFGKIEVYFKDLENELINKINEHKGIIFGCVAWLTSKPIIEALSKKQTQIIIQKEDFFRPDYNDRGSILKRKKEIRKLYSKIKFPYTRYVMKYGINELSYFSSPSIDGIRCVGHHNSDKKITIPRSHHKFLVFCDEIFEKNEDKKLKGKQFSKSLEYNPIAVWTGSFNFTENGTKSFENAIYLEDLSGKNEILLSYLKEHHQVFSLSENLDWESEWASPEYRIGS